MGGHRRVTNVAYDDDDVDDYDEDGYADEGGEQEISASDREQLEQGTIHVKALLGQDIQYSNKEIEETLWYYYFDVDKSVAYLREKHASSKPKAKKQTPSSKFDQAMSAAAQSQPQAKAGKSPHFYSPPSIGVPSSLRQLSYDTSVTVTLSVLNPSTGHTRTENKRLTAIAMASYPLPPILPTHAILSAEEFFKDTPWLNVPPYRLGEITIEPLYPRGRLLGGSSKPSKLAALAAARKKKQEEQKANVANASSGSVEEKPNRAVSLLDRLGSQNKEKDAGTISTPSSESIAEPTPKPPQARTYPIRKEKNESPPPPAEPKEDQPTEEPKEPKKPFFQDLRAQPSTFATTIIWGSGPNHGIKSEAQGIRVFQFPFAHYPEYAKLNPFAGPSPDDIVATAQAKAGKSKGTKSKKPGADAGVKEVAEGVSELTVDGQEQTALKVKSKNLDVPKEYENSKMKQAASFVVVGHVDHGKSTLMGRLLYDLKVVDQRSVDKLRREAENIGKSSFALAWVMDETSEERSRGVTVDIATGNFETDKTRFTILDAPGHQDFIPNMIAGASQADFAILVIDASINSFESGLKGQTKEHALLVRSMGVQRLILAVNKMDTVDWSQSRFEEISQQMSAFLTSAGFQLKNLSFIPCAGLTGENVAKAPEAGKIPWYTGGTLVEALDASEPTTRALTQPLRVTISDIFRGSITNPLSISGRIEAGNVQIGDVILAMPSGETATIKGIEVDSEAVDWAIAGQITTLHLTDIDHAHLRIGDILCSRDKPIQNIQAFTAKILAFEHIMPMFVDVFRGRLTTPARVDKLAAVLDKTSGEIKKKKPRVVKPGEVARVRIELEKPMPLEKGQRVVLRADGVTVAAGLLEASE